MNSLLEALQEGRMVELPDDRNKDRALTILANLIEAIPFRSGGYRRGGVRGWPGRARGARRWARGGLARTRDSAMKATLYARWDGVPSGIEYGAPDGQPVRIVAMYLVPLNQKNAYLREVSGIAKVLQAQTDNAMWTKIHDLTQARNALLDMITVGSGSSVPEARARMIRLEARQAAVEMPAVVALAGLSLQAVTVVAGPMLKPVCYRSIGN